MRFLSFHPFLPLLLICAGLLAGLFLALPIAAQTEPPPPPVPALRVEATTPTSTGPTSTGQMPSALPPIAPLPIAPLPNASAGACPAAPQVQCNSVIRKWRNDSSSVWDTYACLDTKVFASLPFSETHYAIVVDQPNVDLSVAIPETTFGMNVFAALLDDCDNGACAGASHVVSQTILQHAVVQNAAQKTYNLTIDSANLVGQGDAIVACGSTQTGWCANAVAQTLSCRNQRIEDTLSGKPDAITNYGLTLFYDGPEVTYRLLVTDTRYISTTVFYSGSQALAYNNYMSSFLLADTCNQRDLLLFSGLAGETGSTAATKGRWLTPGTYYLVVDGMHMPDGGDAFSMDFACEAPPVTVTLIDPAGAPLFVGEEVEIVVEMRNQAQPEDWQPLLEKPELRHTPHPSLQPMAGSVVLSPAGTLTQTAELAASWPGISPTQSVQLRYRARVGPGAAQAAVDLRAGWQAFGSSTGTAQAQAGPARLPLTVEKQASGGSRPLQIGDRIFYTITVANPDAQAASGFTLTDTLPAEVALVGGSMQPPGTASAGRLVWGGQSLAGGSSRQYSYAVEVMNLPGDGLLENRAELRQPGLGRSTTVSTFQPPLENRLHLPTLITQQ